MALFEMLRIKGTINFRREEDADLLQKRTRFVILCEHQSRQSLKEVLVCILSQIGKVLR